MAEVVSRFLADKHRLGCRKSTIEEYRRGLAQFAQFCSERRLVRLDQITPPIMQDYEDRLRTEGISLAQDGKRRGRPPKANKATSAHEKVKLVKSLVKFAVAWKLIRENPISGYKLPADGKPDVHCYSDAEASAICAHAEPPFGDMFAFLACTGLRQSELRWATRDDVDLTKRLLSIRAKEFPEDGLAWDPKGDDRDVPLCKPAVAMLDKVLAASGSRWLFPAPPGSGVKDDRLRASRLWGQLKKAKRAAGVKRGTLHSFRHLFVSRMANANVSPFKVMKIVGHKSLDIVVTYSHTDEEALLSAVDQVDFGGLLGPPGTAK